MAEFEKALERLLLTAAARQSPAAWDAWSSSGSLREPSHHQHTGSAKYCYDGTKANESRRPKMTNFSSTREGEPSNHALRPES